MKGQRERIRRMAAGLMLAVVAMLGIATLRPEVTTVEARQAGTPAFIQADRCYRFAFAVTGPPNWRVRAIHEHGWISAFVDAGPASAERETVWINTAQILTARQVRCSD